MPTAWAAIVMRPPSSVVIATRKPSPRAPSRRSDGNAHALEREVDRRRRVQAELLRLALDDEALGRRVDDERA